MGGGEQGEMYFYLFSNIGIGAELIIQTRGVNEEGPARRTTLAKLRRFDGK